MSILDDMVGADLAQTEITQDTAENQIFEIDRGGEYLRALGGESVYVATVLGGDPSVTGTGRVRIYGGNEVGTSDVLLYDSGALTLVQSGNVAHQQKLVQTAGGIRYIRGTLQRSTAVGAVSRCRVHVGPEGGQTAYL